MKPDVAVPQMSDEQLMLEVEWAARSANSTHAWMVLNEARVRWMPNVLHGSQRPGTRPRTVEVGMVLCRPADGVCASAWRVESVRAGVSAVLSDCDHHDRRLPVAIAAILHESGGWVLAEDWAAPAEGDDPQ